MPMNLQALLKVLLHEHLDGGLRPQTVIHLARDHGYAGLPTTSAKEMEEIDFQLDDLEKVMLNGIKSAFPPFDQRLRLIYDVIKPGYAKVQEEQVRT